mmetsp:Transcript_32654/g.29533  ORF Transcript_32654/g.29533 Transcript_32654/m.29533 type:complete len:99 (-) Transcript_32654:522-818(-)
MKNYSHYNDKNPNSLPMIRCPNCKTPYDYSVTELRKFNGFQGIRLFSIESLCLLLLILFQIGVLLYDLSSHELKDEAVDKISNYTSENNHESGEKKEQ